MKFNRNYSKMSKTFETKFGPEYKLSSKDGPSRTQDVSVFLRFLYVLLVLVDAGDNKLDQSFLELHQKVLFQ